MGWLGSLPGVVCEDSEKGVPVAQPDIWVLGTRNLGWTHFLGSCQAREKIEKKGEERKSLCMEWTKWRNVEKEVKCADLSVSVKKGEEKSRDSFLRRKEVKTTRVRAPPKIQKGKKGISCQWQCPDLWRSTEKKILRKILLPNGEAVSVWLSRSRRKSNCAETHNNSVNSFLFAPPSLYHRIRS